MKVWLIVGIVISAVNPVLGFVVLLPVCIALVAKWLGSDEDGSSEG